MKKKNVIKFKKDHDHAELDFYEDISAILSPEEKKIYQDKLLEESYVSGIDLRYD